MHRSSSFSSHSARSLGSMEQSSPTSPPADEPRLSPSLMPVAQEEATDRRSRMAEEAQMVSHIVGHLFRQWQRLQLDCEEAIRQEWRHTQNDLDTCAPSARIDQLRHVLNERLPELMRRQRTNLPVGQWSDRFEQLEMTTTTTTTTDAPSSDFEQTLDDLLMTVTETLAHHATPPAAVVPAANAESETTDPSRTGLRIGTDPIAPDSTHSSSPTTATSHGDAMPLDVFDAYFESSSTTTTTTTTTATQGATSPETPLLSPTAQRQMKALALPVVSPFAISTANLAPTPTTMTTTTTTTTTNAEQHGTQKKGILSKCSSRTVSFAEAPEYAPLPLVPSPSASISSAGSSTVILSPDDASSSSSPMTSEQRNVVSADSPIEDPNATTLEVLTGRKRRPTQATLVPHLGTERATTGPMAPPVRTKSGGGFKTDPKQKKITGSRLPHSSKAVLSNAGHLDVDDDDDDNRATLVLDRDESTWPSANTKGGKQGSIRVSSKGLFRAIAPNKVNVAVAELAFANGATFHLLKRCARGWWWMCLQSEKQIQGYVPAAYLKSVSE